MPEPSCWMEHDGTHWSCPACLWDFAVVHSTVEAHRAFEEHWSLSHALRRWQCDECWTVTDDDPGDHDGDLCEACSGGLLREVSNA